MGVFSDALSARRLAGGLCCWFLLGVSSPAWAAPPEAGAQAAEPKPESPEALRLARQHFNRALGLYKSGEYREAIGELNEALTYDPAGKDLVYNRALVLEKLGRIDQAIQGYEQYLHMETDPKLRAQARATIRRLRGARSEVQRSKLSAPRSAPSGSPPSFSPRGRLDGWVVGAGGIAAAAVLVGVIFGVRALATEPSSDDATGPSRSASDLENQAASAHSFAVVADVSFAVAIFSGGTAAALYFMRSPLPQPAVAGAPAAFSPPPLPGATFSFGVHF
jgi:tetratricopeptide (TPR) repeat protein